MSTHALGPTQPALYWEPGFFLGVKQLGPEVNHSHLSWVEVKNEWSSHFTPALCLRDVERDDFISSLPWNKDAR
jgi:hypothetical protein